MKKFGLLILLFCGLFTAFAGDDREAVAAIVRDFRAAQLTFDFNKLLTLCTTDYVQINQDGSQRTYADLQRIAQAFVRIEQSDDLEEILVNYWLITGKTLNEEQLQLIRQAKNTEFGRNLAAEYKGQIAAIKSAYAQIAEQKDQWSPLVEINGNEAEAILAVKTSSGALAYRTCYKLKKVDGKWLIYRNEHMGATVTQ